VSICIQCVLAWICYVTFKFPCNIFLLFNVYEARSMKHGYIYYVMAHTYCLLANGYFIGTCLVMNYFSQKANYLATSLLLKFYGWCLLKNVLVLDVFTGRWDCQSLFLILMLPPCPHSRCHSSECIALLLWNALCAYYHPLLSILLWSIFMVFYFIVFVH